MTNWLAWFNNAFKGYTGSKPQAVFQDSYEYRTDWSPDFFAQFERRRGYRLQNELPALFGQTQDERAARVKYDYRRTVSEIMAEQSEPAWIDWAHRNGLSTIYQACMAHRPIGFDLYGDADIPLKPEMFHNDRSILISKFASVRRPCCHAGGHPLTEAPVKRAALACGTFFTETLADLKYHRRRHVSRRGEPYLITTEPVIRRRMRLGPVGCFTLRTEMNPRNSIWHASCRNAQRIYRPRSCQSISFLESGKPDNDILPLLAGG